PGEKRRGPAPDSRRNLAAIKRLPEGEREAFDLVQVQGISQAEAAGGQGLSNDGQSAAEPRFPAAGRHALGFIRPPGRFGSALNRLNARWEESFRMMSDDPLLQPLLDQKAAAAGPGRGAFPKARFLSNRMSGRHAQYGWRRGTTSRGSSNELPQAS